MTTPEEMAASWNKRHPMPEPDWHWTDVRLFCIKELGYALMYMKYLHPGPGLWEKQRKRVKELCRRLATMHPFNEDNKAESDKYNLEQWMRFHREIQDEIENMC